MTPTLPQHDPRPAARAAALAAARTVYTFRHDLYDGLALAHEVPPGDHPPPAWSDVINHALRDVLANELRTGREAKADWSARWVDLKRMVGELAHGQLDLVVNDAVAALLSGDLGDERARGLGDYAQFFQTTPAPPLLDRLYDDPTFARRYTAGADPEILAAAGPDLPFTDEHLRAASPGDSIERARQERRLFVADYAMLADLPANTLGGVPRHVAPACVLLVIPRDGGPLRPAAILVDRRPGAPVFTPADGWGWALAKLHAAVADTLAGAIWFHHARTHLVAEPLFLAAWRQLAPNHPVRALLAPHAVGTLYINHVGSTSVFAEHGLIDWIAGTPREGVRALARRSVHSFRFDESVFPRALAARGVDVGSGLVDFPYRDDAMLVWEAVRAWVADYLGLYYRSDDDVLADVELAGWVREASAVDGGGVRGFGEAGLFRTREGLTDAVAQLIFSVSAQHSAMNFPVSVDMTVIPNSPFAAYQPPPDHRDGWTEADWLAALPPLGAAQRQFGTALLLGEARYGRLGEYPDRPFDDPAVEAPLQAFRARLEAVEARITARNAEREPYIHLLPSRIAPSISI
jgi:arachidonate 15-lipoxygenase